MENKLNMRKGALYLAIAAILWSTGGVCIKFVPFSALAIVGLRGFFAYIVLCLYRRSFKIRLTKSTLLGGIALSCTSFGYVFANKLTTAANAIVLQYTSPIFVIVFMWLIFRIRPKARDIIAALVVVAGIAVFFLDNLSEGQMLGNILAILAGVTFSLVFVSKQMKGAVPIEALQLSLMINSIVGLPFAFAGGASADPLGWGLIIFLGIFQIGVAFIFFARGLEIVPPLSALLISTLEPILNPIWVMLIYGEVPGTFALIGAVIVIVSVLTYNIIDMKKSATEQIKISEKALPNELN